MTITLAPARRPAITVKSKFDLHPEVFPTDGSCACKGVCGHYRTPGDPPCAPGRVPLWPGGPALPAWVERAERMEMRRAAQAGRRLTSAWQIALAEAYGMLGEVEAAVQAHESDRWWE